MPIGRIIETLGGQLEPQPKLPETMIKVGVVIFRVPKRKERW